MGFSSEEMGKPGIPFAEYHVCIPEVRREFVRKQMDREGILEDMSAIRVVVMVGVVVWCVEN